MGFFYLFIFCLFSYLLIYFEIRLHYGDQASLELRDQHTLASQVLGLTSYAPHC